MSKTRWANRTIRNGRVRIEGRTFVPKGVHRAYDGRLDGMRYLFGLYRDEPDGPIREFVECWGPSAYAKLDPDTAEAEACPRPEIVEGTFPWLFWTVLEAEKECSRKHVDRVYGYDPEKCPGSPVCDWTERDADGRPIGKCLANQWWTLEGPVR